MYVCSHNQDIMQKIIESAWKERQLLTEKTVQKAIRDTVEKLDKGLLRVAEPSSREDKWKVNEWIKKAIILYFIISEPEVTGQEPFEYYDKIKLKKGYRKLGVRVVPPAAVRYGAYVAPGSILMPSYVNIGAYVGKGTMVDTWATVGSCAQIGADVHISGGVGIGGVLEPPQAAPVIIEDGCFIGSRSIIVEGVLVRKAAVIGAGVVLTASTRIIDVTGKASSEFRKIIPPRSVVIPGSYSKQFPAGDYQVPCALIIGKRKASTDLKTSLNEALRNFNVPL